MNQLQRALRAARKGQFDLAGYHLRRALGQESALRPLPSELSIEPTNACNLHCPTCPTGSGKMNRAKRMMRLHEFAAIIDQVRGYVSSVELWSYGEPFLNRDLLEMIRYAPTAGIHVRTSTNAEFFETAEFCRDLVQSGLHHLIVCMDGADQETLSRFRKGSDFHRIFQGLHRLMQARTQLGSSLPKVELQFILMRHNQHQRALIKDIARELGMDVFSEKTVGIPFNDPEFEAMAREFLPDDLSLTRYRLDASGRLMLDGRVPNRCHRLQSHAVINSDGTVVPCCYDLYSEFVMGNVFQESLRTIWKGTSYEALRVQIARDRTSIPMCNACPVDRIAISKETDLANGA
jgi:radical SAM protein with 4Fe4S-binding SPASM domain